MRSNGLPVGRITPSSFLLIAWQLMTVLWARGGYYRILARCVRSYIRRTYGCYIAPTSRVGRGVYLPHPVGVVIGDNSIIDDGVTIYQNVTLGQSHAASGESAAPKSPRIQAGATIFAGAILLGDIVIGENAIVGANAVVRTSVPAGRIAVGVPARIIVPS